MSRSPLRFALSLIAALITLDVAQARTPSVVIGYENNGADPYMVTQSLHLFQKMVPAQITLKFFASGPAAMSALASGSLQFMCGIGIPPFVSAISQGLPLAIIFNQERYTMAAGLVVRPGHGIKTIADLKGHKIAIVEGSQSSFELATFLAEAHVPFRSVRQINMSPPEMRVAWSTKSINAAIVWDPVFDSLRGMGAKVIKTDANLPRDASSYNVCIAETAWVRAHKAIATDFIHALAAGVSYTKRHPKKALGLMANTAGITLPVAKSELAGYEIFSGKDQTTDKVLGSGKSVPHSATTLTLANTAKVLLKIGRISKMPKDITAAVDPAFAEAAEKGAAK